MSGVTAGDTLSGRFELTRRLGAGGLAEVFAARDRLSDSEVAVKILHPHVAEDRDLAERFRRELAVTRGLDHPAIVRVFDLHEHEARPFFTMELLRGQTLGDRLHEGVLEPDLARRVVKEVCAALIVAHKCGVVHRDLKPQNIFLTESGQVKLLDFGLARVAGLMRLTSQSAVMGTPGYVAPELFAGQRADARADLYSLGASWFEAVCGRRPFTSSDPYEMARLQRERPPSPRKLRPLLSFEDDAIIQRLLQPDPEQRFLDARQLFRALGGEEIPLPPLTPPPLTAGELDVLVYSVIHPLELLRGRQPIADVLERLGAPASSTWKLQLAGAGQAVLVSGASRRTAEAAASVCAEFGLPATIRPVKERPWSEEVIARHGPWALALLGALLPAGLAVLMGEGWPTLLAWSGAGALVGYLLSWGLRPPASVAPLTGLPAQDSSLARLATGIGRRAARLKQDRAALPAEQQPLVDQLTHAADEAAELARRLSSEPARPEPQSEPRGLDLATNHLLEVAAALDDALCIASAGSESRALRRLHDDVALARQALPGLLALGEAPAAPPAPQPEAPKR